MPKTLTVSPKVWWVDTSVDVQAGRPLVLSASGRWTDAGIASGPDGWDRWFMAPGRLIRRVRGAKWLALMGAIDRREDTAFLIGSSWRGAAPASGRLWVFANDAKGFYWNNDGHVDLTIATE